MEKRHSTRHRTLFDVAFSAGRIEGEGVLADLSAGGASVERASVRPPIGSQIRIDIFVEPRRAVQLVATVNRLTETGFGVDHDGLCAELEALDADMAAIAEGEKQPELET